MDTFLRKSIFPILKLGLDNQVLELIGTGFLVSQRPMGVTAARVFLDNPLGANEKYGKAILHEDKLWVNEIPNFYTSRNYDVAVFAADKLPGAAPLRVMENPASTSQDVLCCHFCNVNTETLADGRPRVISFPYIFKGNVLRHYVSEYPEKVETPCFELSFACLDGAVGAPILRAEDLAVCGMVLSNVEHALLPAVIDRIRSDETEMMHRTYLRPLGKGLETSVILAYMQNLDIEPEVVE